MIVTKKIVILQKFLLLVRDRRGLPRWRLSIYSVQLLFEAFHSCQHCSTATRRWEIVCERAREWEIISVRKIIKKMANISLSSVGSCFFCSLCSFSPFFSPCVVCTVSRSKGTTYRRELLSFRLPKRAARWVAELWIMQRHFHSNWFLTLLICLLLLAFFLFLPPTRGASRAG